MAAKMRKMRKKEMSDVYDQNTAIDLETTYI